MNLLEVLDRIPIETTISLQTRLRNELYSFDNCQREKAKLYYRWPVKKVEKSGENLYKVVLEI